MIAIDGVPGAVARHRGEVSVPLPDVLAHLTSEYFVEWQVDDRGLAPAVVHAEK